MHKSGSNDFNVLSTACYQFKLTNNGKPFGHQKAWEVCRQGPKWVLNPETSHSDPTTGSNKRTRTSELDAGFRLDLNDDVDGAEEEGPPEVQLRRPPSRDKAKRAASSSGKATATSDDGLVESIDKTLSFLEKKYQSAEEGRRQKLALTDLQIINTKPQPDLDLENLATFLKIQQRVRAKYDD
ncbi:uncharacterized protein LOC128127653 [Lactuca sativa]|uniref:uncharacterized protein LOC128127653 n=1 Tax=Lactuca sativa TaxID=4236 RepID=UPI0022AEB091|nr:uncharacterized protein LOC128127653 [Lactuca sativa]